MNIPTELTEGLVDVLRALEHAASSIEEQDAEEIVALCQQWRRHLLEGEVAPGEGGGLAPDWLGACQFTASVIRRERDFVVTRLDDFRQMIWVVIQGLRGAFLEEQSLDQEVITHLDRLRGAAESDSVSELRSEVVAAVVLIGRAIENRRRLQNAQLEDLGAQLNKMRSELLRAQREMELDPMTRLYNRRSLDELLVKTIELSVLSGQSACLLLVDVDHFKRVNDTYGHGVGDRAIIAIADCLKKTFPRKSDLVCRYGGDEFMVVLQDTEALDGQMLAKRLLASVKNVVVLNDDDESVPLSLSVGVAGIKKGDEAESWLARTDQALYQAKRAGRGCEWLAQ